MILAAFTALSFLLGFNLVSLRYSICIFNLGPWVWALFPSACAWRSSLTLLSERRCL